MSQGTAAPAEQPCKYDWTPGQLAQAVAQFVIALGAALLRFEPTTLLPLLLKNGANLVEKLGEAIAAFNAEVSLVLLPLFADVFDKGWQVLEDGLPLPEDWDPTAFFAGLKIRFVHADGETYLTGEELVKRIRGRMIGRREFDQHVLAWLIAHWDDPCIPAWFKETVESGEVVVVATGTILLSPSGCRYILCLHWGRRTAALGLLLARLRLLAPLLPWLGPGRLLISDPWPFGLGNSTPRRVTAGASSCLHGILNFENRLGTGGYGCPSSTFKIL